MVFQWNLSLPTFTSREDIVLPISIADDDTGSFINLAGITLAPANPNGFTGSSWTLTDGNIITPSISTITIPGYPIGSQLSALTFVVGTGLGILAGDFATVVDPTGLNTFFGYVTSYTPSSGSITMQVGWTFQFEIRRRPAHSNTSGYTLFFDVGVEDNWGPLITASLGNGILITDLGYININIPEVTVKTVSGNATYLANLTMTDSQNTRQVFSALLPIIKGEVTN